MGDKGFFYPKINKENKKEKAKYYVLETLQMCINTNHKIIWRILFFFSFTYDKDEV